MTALLLSALLLQTAPAAPSGWTDVMAIAPNASIRVRVPAGTVSGVFVSATPDAIVLRDGGRNIPMNRTSVTAVDVAKSKPHRGRNIGLGVLAGAGAGLVLQHAVCQGNNCMAEAAFIYTVPLEGIGMIVGAVVPDTSWRTVYRR